MYFGAINRRRYGPPVTRTYDDLLLDMNPIARWKLTEGSGTTATDSAGSLDGTYAGTYTLADTPLWQGGTAAAKFTSGYVSIPSGTALDRVNGSPWAVCAWVRLTSSSAGAVRASILNNLVNSAFGYSNASIWLAASGGSYYPQGGWTETTSNVMTFSASASAVTLNDIYHIAMTFDGTTRTLLVNGVAVDSDNGNNASPATTGGTYLGGDAANPGSYKFVGNLGDVCVFNTCPTVAQFLALYNAGHL